MYETGLDSPSRLSSSKPQASVYQTGRGIIGAAGLIDVATVSANRLRDLRAENPCFTLILGY
jgi:hypothetical protein